MIYSVNGKLMTTVCFDDTAAVLLDNIFRVMSEETFSKDKAAAIVGGEKRLSRLIAEGKIKADKPNNSQNGKWFCNAAQVLAHCRPFKKNKSQTNKKKKK